MSGTAPTLELQDGSEGQNIEPDADITIVNDTFMSEAGAAQLARASVIFGCMDRDGARLLLNEFACAYNRPYLDIATDTAVTEFMVFVTGVPRAPKRLLRYDGLRGIVNEPKDPPRPDCPYCTQAAAGDAVNWLRHVRAGLGRWVR